MTKKIIFSTGGTGGHIFPALNLMKHFSEKGYEVLIVTDNRGNNFIKRTSEFKSYILKTSTLTNKNFIKFFFSIFVIFYSMIKSIIILKKEKPDLIFGFGGYVSFPISFVSNFLNIPLLIYENNMIFGRANRYLSKFSKKILIANNIETNFLKKYKEKIYEVGPILNKDIINTSLIAKDRNKSNFTILVLGGSQGAEIFGKIIPSTIVKVKKLGYEIEIIQQCLLEQKDSISSFYDNNNIKNYIFDFDKNILKLILRTDLAISRCGASTTSELTHTITPFIAVPLPDSIDNHQYLNAKYYEKKGCCMILEQKNFNTDNLFNLIIETVKNKNKLEIMRTNMKKNYRNNVYSNIESHIKEII